MIEKCADESDRATQIADQANEQALLQRRADETRRLAGVKRALDDGDFDGVHCIACDDELPPARIADHRMKCTACQTAEEVQAKQRGKR